MIDLPYWSWKALGVSVDIISRSTGLSEEQIEGL